MRAPCAILCLTAWLLGALNQVTVMLMAPNRLVIFGTDLTQEGAQLVWHQTLLTFVGLALAGAGLFKHRLAPILTIAASVFYLWRWLPLGPIRRIGLLTTLETRFRLGLQDPLWWSFVVRDIVLPLAFIAVIFCVAATRSRGRRMTQ